MSIFSSAINGFRSTASQVGKFYNSPGARAGVRLSRQVARQSFTGSGAAAMIGGNAALGAVGGGLIDKDHRGRGMVRGAFFGGAFGGMARLGANSTVQNAVARNVTPAIRKGIGAVRTRMNS